MFNFFKSAAPAPVTELKQRSLYTTADTYKLSRSEIMRNALKSTFQRAAAQSAGIMDGVGGDPNTTSSSFGGIPDAQLSWYGNQGFIGYQACAMIAQHWLVDKACTIPARDAIRKGYEITVNNGQKVATEILEAMVKLDEEFNLNKNLVEFVKMGRVFGVRVAMFKVLSTDPDYYTKPYNPDGVTPKSYKGIVQIDPYWCTPELSSAAFDPMDISFYEPDYWVISGVRVHKSHLTIMRNGDVADLLKPTYFYGGVPIPQRIYERVYAAERTANEAPQLVMTKRTNIFKTDIEQALLNPAKFEQRLSDAAYYKDNYATLAIDKDDEDIAQLDTPLADLDNVIMTQYQLVAAIANIPATKLLGTSPKGFGASGEYEEANYREELESIQTFDLIPLINRHHELLMRSVIAPTYGITFNTTVAFNPLDSLTEIELADVNLKKAQTDVALTQAGGIDGQYIHARIISDPRSGHNEIVDDEPLDEAAPE